MPLFQISSLEQTHHPNMRFSASNVNVILKKILYPLYSFLPPTHGA